MGVSGSPYSCAMAADIRVVDLFAGCGGITQGLKDAGVGFKPVAAVEIDRHAAATYAANHGSHVHVGDIADWVRGSLPKADVVVGGPPCQGFSALGKQNPNDPRNSLWRHYVDTLRRVRPAFFVLENVPQFLKSSEFQLFSKEATPGGDLEAFRLEPFILNSADYGAPQARRRAVVIGRRKELDEVGPPVQSGRRVLRQAFPDW